MATGRTISNSKNLWHELDTSSWTALPLLGSKWLGKWTFSHKGYSLMITDGVEFWGEQRDSSYVENKSQEWAACLESEPKELSELVLSQFEEKDGDLKLTQETDNGVTIELTALLDQLPYNWVFHLSKLSAEVIERHWSVPIATILELMSNKVKKLEEELKKRTDQLEELSSQPVPKKDQAAVFNYALDNAAENVLSRGLGTVICGHLTHSPLVIQKLDLRQREGRTRDSSAQLRSSLPHNRPRAKLRKALKGAFGNDTSVLQDSEEANRRAQIQALTQAPIIQNIKKKKKLKI